MSANYNLVSHLFNRFGTWGVCFTYGTLFAVKGLLAAGRTYENSSSVRKACRFLLSKQLRTGGWGETYPSSETEVIHYLPYLAPHFFLRFSHVMYSCFVIIMSSGLFFERTVEA
jgi:hypothetical protein